MCSCDQSLVTVAFLWGKLPQPQFDKDLTRKTAFFERWSWFKFNNLGLALGTNLKFYTSLAKWLKLKVIKFRGLIPTFVEVTGEKLVGRPPPPPILNRVKYVFSFFWSLNCTSLVCKLYISIQLISDFWAVLILERFYSCIFWKMKFNSWSFFRCFFWPENCTNWAYI